MTPPGLEPTQVENAQTASGDAIASQSQQKQVIAMTLLLLKGMVIVGLAIFWVLLSAQIAR